MKQFNSACCSPDVCITGGNRLNGGHVINTIALSVKTRATLLPPHANGGIGAR